MSGFCSTQKNQRSCNTMAALSFLALKGSGASDSVRRQTSNAAQQLLIDLLVQARGALNGILLSNNRLSPLGEIRCALRVIVHEANAPCQRFTVRPNHKHSRVPVLERRRNPANLGCDDWNASLHRFEKHYRQALRYRGQDKHVKL